MNTLEIAYKILYSLENEKKADYMGIIISPAKLGIEPEKWADVLKTLCDEGYISGVKFTHDILGQDRIDIGDAKITMKGAEYLHENSTMKKFGEIATNVITVLKSS